MERSESGGKAFQLPRIPLRSMRATRQNLILGRKAGRKATRWGFGDAYRLFPWLEEMAATPAGVISGGEQQMLTICRTLMGDPDLIMIDEPTEGLAPQMVERIASLLKSIAERHISIRSWSRS